MSKRFRCKLGLHHWHYECKAAFPSLYVEATCYYCGKDDLTTGLTAKEWFNFGWSWTWDKHNPAWQMLKNEAAPTTERGEVGERNG